MVMPLDTHSLIHRRTTLTPEQLAAWRQNVLALDIPSLLSAYTRKLDKLPAHGLHLYVRQDYVRSVQQWRSLRRHTQLVSHVFLNGEESNRSVRTFMHALTAYELERFATRNKKKNFNPNAHTDQCQPIILNTFKFCLPQQMTDPSQYRAFAVAMAQRILATDDGILPFFYMISTAKQHLSESVPQAGDTRYLWLCTTERFWYPDGQQVNKTYNRDYYWIPQTGKTSAVPVEGAVLKHKKGDVFGTETVNFSLKTRKFSFAGKGAWNRFFKKIRGAMLTYFKEHGFGRTVFMLPRLAYDQYRANSRKHKACRTVNVFMAHMESEIDTYAEGFYVLNIEDQMYKFYSPFKNCRRDMIETMQRGSYRQHGRSWQLDFNALISNEALKNNLDVVGERFIKSIKNVLAPLFENA